MSIDRGHGIATSSVLADSYDLDGIIAKYEQFADTYLGHKAVEPTTDDDGDALIVGALYFNTVDNELRVYDGTDWQAVYAGALKVNNFTGDGATVAYTLTTAPNNENSTQVYIDGVYQQKDTYTTVGAVLTFSEAPPTSAGIEVMIISSFEVGITDAQNVTYSQGGTGASSRTVENKLQETVSVKDFGAVGDGVTDDTAAINAALAASDNVFVPAGVYSVTSTIVVGTSGKRLVGDSPALDNYYTDAVSVIQYNGVASNTTAVIQLGGNAVGAEPSTAGSNNQLINLHIDANSLAGFCVYGTYATNGSIIRDCSFRYSLEYNLYIARSWYATYENLVSHICRGKGLAFGMPLILQDGTDYSGSWITSAPLQMNQTMISNVRSAKSGRYYAVDNLGTYDPTNTAHRRHGYGIGAGIGNGFSLTDFLSENSGGVNLYLYSGGQPKKNVTRGYLESSCDGSGLDITSTLPNIIIENLVDFASGSLEVKDIFCNFNGGGILHTGALTGYVWLRNLHQPRFMSSLDGVGYVALNAHLLKDSVYWGCGFYNTIEGLMSPSGYKSGIDTTGTFTVTCLPGGANTAIYVKSNVTTSNGSYTLTYTDGTTASYAYPSPMPTTGFELLRVVTKAVVSITRSGGAGTATDSVTFKVLSTPDTSI